MHLHVYQFGRTIERLIYLSLNVAVILYMMNYTGNDTTLTVHVQLCGRNSGGNSEQPLNSSAVVAWKGWSCDAGVVFSTTHSHELSTRLQRRELLCAEKQVALYVWSTAEPSRARLTSFLFAEEENNSCFPPHVMQSARGGFAWVEVRETRALNN